MRLFWLGIKFAVTRRWMLFRVQATPETRPNKVGAKVRFNGGGARIELKLGHLMHTKNQGQPKVLPFAFLFQ
jgi:hypothetical protein